MSVFAMLAQHADMAVQHLHVAGAMVTDAAIHHGQAGLDHARDNLVVLAQAATEAPAAAPGDGISVEEFKEKLESVTQEEQLGWLTAAGKYFIGIFQEGGRVFAGFVTSLSALGAVGVAGAILPLLMTVALTGLEFLVSFLQAYVFAVLTCMYLNDAVHPGGH